MAADLTDDLIMAVEVIRKDLSDTQKTLSKAESMLGDYDTRIARQELIFGATYDALKHLVGSPVIGMSEFRSLKSGIKISSDELLDLRQKRTRVLAARNKALAKIPDLARQLQEAEDRLDRYEPPRVVLEFPRRDQQ